MLIFDGREGEGGGQILRTCLSLSAITGRAFKLNHIRGKRKKPGLRPQHLTGVRAVARICNAHVIGDALNSMTLAFRPGTKPIGSTYIFDVTKVAQGGSAGAVTLVFQAILWPLLFADKPANVTLRGGTHVPFSPPYHFANKVAQPAFAKLGAEFSLLLGDWGWFPAGGGQVTLTTQPINQLQPATFEPLPDKTIRGLSAVTNLPAHIPNRMTRRAENLLRAEGLNCQIQSARERGRGAGAGIFLWLPHAGFSALGRKGLPAQKVAEYAVNDLLNHLDHPGSAVDPHLADQLLLPMALAHGTSTFTTSQLTQHTLTNAALLQEWLDVSVTIDGGLDEPGRVTLTGANQQNSH